MRYKFEESDLEDKARSRRDVFISLQEKCDIQNPEQKERFGEVKNIILEKVKATQRSRTRSSSGGSTKRSRSRDPTNSGRSVMRTKTTLIPTKF